MGKTSGHTPFDHPSTDPTAIDSGSGEKAPDLDVMADTLREAGYTVEAPQPRYYADGPYIHDRAQQTGKGRDLPIAMVRYLYEGDRDAFAEGIADLANRLNNKETS